jgi:hypothetical protein
MGETEDAERIALMTNTSLIPESTNQEENVVVFTGADHFNEQVSFFSLGCFQCIFCQFQP